MGSGIEGEPLLGVVWVVPVHSESVLVVANMLMPEEGLVGWHS